jgi:hypothetical protein
LIDVPCNCGAIEVLAKHCAALWEIKKKRKYELLQTFLKQNALEYNISKPWFNGLTLKKEV